MKQEIQVRYFNADLNRGFVSSGEAYAFVAENPADEFGDIQREDLPAQSSPTLTFERLLKSSIIENENC